MTDDRSPQLVRPRSNATDQFEINPLSMVEERSGGPQAAEAPDRVREAVRMVVEDGIDVNEAAARQHVAPSLVVKWRQRYFELLAAAPVLEADTRPVMEQVGMAHDADLVALPALARRKFAENWQQLVTVVAPAPQDFIASDIAYFLQTSRLTRWLYHEGKLDRSVFSGALIVLLGTLLTAGFALSQRQTPAAIVRVQEAPAGDLEMLEQAEKLALYFLKAPSPDAMAALCRDRARVTPLIRNHFATRPHAPIADGVINFSFTDAGIVNLLIDSPSLGRHHFLCVVNTDDGLQVDWESSSFFQEQVLVDLRKNKPVQPVRVNVRIVRADYYNYAFADSAQWVCYQLKYPGLEMDLFGYCRRDSSIATVLSAISSDPADSLPPQEGEEGTGEEEIEDISRLLDNRERGLARPAVLMVRYPEGDWPETQVEIVEFISDKWVPLQR